MDTQERQKLDSIMARMAAGDTAAAITLYREFGDRVRAKVARIARSQGAAHLTRDDLDGMAIDACLDLADRAGSWDPDGGALPWVWAERRIVVSVGRTLGRYGPSFDETDPPDGGEGWRGGAREGVAFAGDDPDGDETLARLATRSAECALLCDALGRASARNRRVFLDYEMQQAAGDPSPSHTVGATYGLTPDNVRQIVRRVRTRLSALAASDPRYAALGELALLREAKAA